MIPAVSLEPGELLFRELADGDSELGAQIVEGAQLSPEIARYVPVLQAKLVESEVGHAAGAESGDFLDHSVGQALPEALFDSFYQDFAGPGQPELKAVVARGVFVGGRMRVAGGGDFDGPDEPAPVAFVDAAGCVRVGFFQPLDQLREGKGLEFCAQLVVWGDIHQLIAFDDRADV